MVKYFFMHRNDICGIITFNDKFEIKAYKDYGNKCSPYMGNLQDTNKIKQWWQMRTVPTIRSFEQNEYLSPTVYLTKNNAISVVDSYWICFKHGIEPHLKYEEVKYSSNPNASLGGRMYKFWDLKDDSNDSRLIKYTNIYDGQQCINEIFATYIHTLQNTNIHIPFVKYMNYNYESYTACQCKSFIDKNNKIELIPAFDIIESQKCKNDKSFYQHYIDLCVEYGIDREYMQDYIDYQILTDFIISNTDRHLLNFGVLRDTETLKLLGPAPIFDSGNSMFYDESRFIPFKRSELLSRPITSFHKTEDKMLAKVKNKNIVKLDLLPTINEVKDFYADSGIPEEKANFISHNYETKLEMLEEFQKGKKISLYNEKHQER